MVDKSHVDKTDEWDETHARRDALKEAVDGYAATVDRLEPNIHMIDNGAGFASIAISLKRIADTLEEMLQKLGDQRNG